MIHLIFSFVWAAVGSVATKYYAKNYEEHVFNPLPTYIAFSFMVAGIELAKFTG